MITNIRLKPEGWHKLSTDEFVRKMRAVVRECPKVLCTPEFGECLPEWRRAQIEQYNREHGYG